MEERRPSSINSSSAITTLIGNEFREEEQEDKWVGSVAVSTPCRKRIRTSSSNDYDDFQQQRIKIYGIPCSARQVITFEPISHTQTLIGPDLGTGRNKWYEGTADNKGCIYCMPSGYDTNTNHCGILKINTKNDTVQELDSIHLLLPHGPCLWGKGVLAQDDNIYYMPQAAPFLLQLDPNKETIDLVGENLGNGPFKYCGGVLSTTDGCIYGIPDQSNRIAKYNPKTQVTTFVGKELPGGKYFQCVGNGAMAREDDGCIYAAKWNGIVLKIDTLNDNWLWVGNRVELSRDEEFIYEFGDAVLGIDGCIYWPPRNTNRTLKYDPYIDQSSLVGCDFGDGCDKWVGGVLADDIIYCMPSDANGVLAIDPFREFRENMEMDMKRYPVEEFGHLFLKTQDYDDDRGSTAYDVAVIKFGHSKVFHAIVGLLPSPYDVITPGRKQQDSSSTSTSNTADGLYPFMAAASYPNIDLSIIYHLLRPIPYVIIPQH